MIDVVPIRAEHVSSFHSALNAVCRERKYLALMEAPPIDSARAFVLHNIDAGVPQFVALADGSSLMAQPGSP